MTDRVALTRSTRVAYRVTLLAVLCLVAVACGSTLSADAGEDFSVNVGESPVFDGCASAGDDLQYSWAIVAAPSDMADDVGKVLREPSSECSFTLESDMEVADTGRWEIELTVTSGDADPVTDRVVVTVR